MQKDWKKLKKPKDKHQKVSLYDEVVALTSEYLGPAADRFINRQIRNHLNKNPESLTADDISELLAWIKLSMVFLTDDKAIVEDYIESLRLLGAKN